MGICGLIKRVALEQWRKVAEDIDLHEWCGSDDEKSDGRERVRVEAAGERDLGVVG